MSQVMYVYINPFAPRDFAEKHVLKLVVLVHLLAFTMLRFGGKSF